MSRISREEMLRQQEIERKAREEAQKQNARMELARERARREMLESQRSPEDNAIVEGLIRRADIRIAEIRRKAGASGDSMD